MSMAKRVGDLEATLWARAEKIETPHREEIAEFIKSTSPLDTPIFNAWLNGDRDAEKLNKRTLQIERSLLPIHPAFLPDYVEVYRIHQWALHRSNEYRELTDTVWVRFLEYVRAHYDMTGGLLGVALCLYEKDFDKWTAHREYIGKPASREMMAGDQIELWKIVRRKDSEADEPEDQKTQSTRWREALIENVFNLYGREMTEDDLDFDQKMWAQLDKDMAAGKPASESEAAAYLRGLFDRYPHKVMSSSAA
jgi:hypothetical protein